MGIKNFLTKKREGWIFGFSSWILNNPKALSIMLFIAPILTAIVLTTLTSLFWIYKINGILKMVFTVVTLLTYVKVYEVIRAYKRTGSIEELIDSSVNDVFYGGKNGNGNKDAQEDAEDEYGRISKDNASDGNQIKRIDRPKRRNRESFSDLIQESNSDSKED